MTVAVFSLGWNVYRDVLLKGRVQVSMGVKNILHEGASPSVDYIGIRATNHGPGKVALETIALRDTSIWKKLTKKQKYAFLMYDYKNPYTGHLPKSLDVGESIDLFGNFDKDCFLKEQLTHLGLNDSFGRTHWAPKKQMKELRKKWVETFGIDT